MAAQPTIESFCFNPFLAKDYLNDSNQDPDINFYNYIFSINTSYLLSCEATKKLKHFSLETFYNSLNVCLSIICLSETWVNDNNPEKKTPWDSYIYSRFTST